MAVTLVNGVGYTLGAASDEVLFRHRITSITVKGTGVAGNAVIQVKPSANNPSAAYTTLFDIAVPANDTVVIAPCDAMGAVEACKVTTFSNVGLVSVTYQCSEC